MAKDLTNTEKKAISRLLSKAFSEIEKDLNEEYKVR